MGDMGGCGTARGVSGGCEDSPGVRGGEEASESSAGDRRSTEETLDTRLKKGKYHLHCFELTAYMYTYIFTRS